jgi:hypothetical protein
MLVAAHRAWAVIDRWNTWIVLSNLARRMDICLCYLCVVCSRVGRRLQTGQSPCKDSYKSSIRSIGSEVNSQWETGQRD